VGPGHGLAADGQRLLFSDRGREHGLWAQHDRQAGPACRERERARRWSGGADMLGPAM
jgi:hypothetical protein